MASAISSGPEIEIVHEPTSVYRVRYETEKQTPMLFAENANKSIREKNRDWFRLDQNRREIKDTGVFPKIKVKNFEGPATLNVSCVSVSCNDPNSEKKYVFPHKFVPLDEKDCNSGIVVLKKTISPTDDDFELYGFSIKSVKEDKIIDRINELKNIPFEPFGNCYRLYEKEEKGEKRFKQSDFFKFRLRFEVVLGNVRAVCFSRIIEHLNPSTAITRHTLNVCLKVLIKNQNIRFDPDPQFQNGEVWLKLVVPFPDQKNWETFMEWMNKEDKNDDIEDDAEPNLKKLKPITSKWVNDDKIQDEENSDAQTSTLTLSKVLKRKRETCSSKIEKPKLQNQDKQSMPQGVFAAHELVVMQPASLNDSQMIAYSQNYAPQPLGQFQQPISGFQPSTSEYVAAQFSQMHIVQQQPTQQSACGLVDVQGGIHSQSTTEQQQQLIEQTPVTGYLIDGQQSFQQTTLENSYIQHQQGQTYLDTNNMQPTLDIPSMIDIDFNSDDLTSIYLCYVASDKNTK